MSQAQPSTGLPPIEPFYPPLRPRPWPLWVPGLFLGLALVSTAVCGLLYYANFSDASADTLSNLLAELPQRPWILLYGLPYSLALLGILMAHELGHYLTCRYYKIDATPPYVLPAPLVLPIPPFLAPLFSGVVTGQWVLLLFNPFGTFGAVIRIRSPFHNRRQLFDVGVAGPLAGFAVIVPVLVLAMLLSDQYESLPEGGWLFGEPWLFRLAAGLLRPEQDPALLKLHPIGWAAWFGMLATSLNLLPIGQLDGGHMVYAMFGRRVHYWVSRLTFVGLIAVSFYSNPPFVGYIFFGLLGLLLGGKHPPALNDHDPPGGIRWLISLVALMILVLTFIPVPFQIQ